MTVDLDEQGRLRAPGGRTVPGNRISEHLAEHVRTPERITDLYVYVHGWQTAPAVAQRRAKALLTRTRQLAAAHPDRYPQLSRGYRPAVVVVRWPSSSPPSLGGYRRIRDRAHAMSAPGQGHAPHVLAHLLGYLDAQRPVVGSAPVMTNRNGQYLHLVGHSFGGRFLCEAVQWAAAPEAPRVLGWSTPTTPGRAFTVDSMVIFQMAAPRDAFDRLFPALFPSGAQSHAPLRGPLVLTHSRWDRATGFWHLRAEGSAGIGHSGAGTAPVPQFHSRLLPLHEPYRLSTLDHRLVNVDASERFRGSARTRLAPAGAHSDFDHPESAHLLLSLAALSRGSAGSQRPAIPHPAGRQPTPCRHRSPVDG
ncbi:hypothetical protein [Streptomyces griseus]|uniref:hypothetical protein n=1 Tax=Streptomyces griseus TaxID=1911 RepID=UPI0036F97D5F